jgi:hypothetical protein
VGKIELQRCNDEFCKAIDEKGKLKKRFEETERTFAQDTALLRAELGDIRCTNERLIEECEELRSHGKRLERDLEVVNSNYCYVQDISGTNICIPQRDGDQSASWDNLTDETEDKNFSNHMADMKVNKNQIPLEDDLAGHQLLEASSEYAETEPPHTPKASDKNDLECELLQNSDACTEKRQSQPQAEDKSKVGSDIKDHCPSKLQDSRHANNHASHVMLSQGSFLPVDVIGIVVAVTSDACSISAMSGVQTNMIEVQILAPLVYEQSTHMQMGGHHYQAVKVRDCLLLRKLYASFDKGFLHLLQIETKNGEPFSEFCIRRGNSEYCAGCGHRFENIELLEMKEVCNRWREQSNSSLEACEATEKP